MLDTDTWYELDTVPFTGAERRAIEEYDRQIDGVVDTLDVVKFYDDENCGPGDTAGEVRAYFELLSQWYEALDSLYSDLRNRLAGPAFSVAGQRYLKHQITAWYRALHTVRREACRYAFGTVGPQPEMLGNYVTFMDVPGIELDATIAAEST